MRIHLLPGEITIKRNFASPATATVTSADVLIQEPKFQYINGHSYKFDTSDATLNGMTLAFSLDPSNTDIFTYKNVTEEIVDSNTNEQTEGILQSQINEKLKTTKFFYDTYLGRLSNIFLNVNYIAQIMDSAPKDPETGALSLLQLLKQINKGVINALGGINSFDIKLSDNMSKIRFIEEIP